MGAGDEAKVHGSVAAALISGGMGLAFAALGAQGSGGPAFVLAGCHLLVALIAFFAPRHTSASRADQLLAGGATLTVTVGALVVPDAVLPIIPLGCFAGVLIGAGLRSRAHAVAWVLIASVMYAASMWLRGRAGLVLADWGAAGTLLLFAVPPVMFAGFVVRSQSIAARFRRELELREVMQRKIARSNRELESARLRAEASNEAKSSFLANMSHELRTPLNAIIGYSEILAEEAEERGDANTLSDLEKIRSAGQHLVSLVSDVLDISKIEAGKMLLEVQTFDLSRLIADVKTDVEPLALKNGNTLVIHTENAVGEAVGDPTKLRQVLLNLLSNACKFTQNGNVSMTVNPRGADVTADWLVFVVRDDGIGMSPAQLAKVFLPFTQADSSTTRRFGGTGLGLALSQQYCRLMGGEIQSESEEGVGSTFTVRIPRQLADPDAAPTREPVSTSSAPPVLVVDDDQDARDLLRRALETGGFAVAEAEDGQEALAHLARDSASVIVLDLEMPVMSGYELLSEIKARRELACIPVVVVTGKSPDKERLRAHAVQIFQKGSWKPAELVQSVERHLRRAEVRCVETAMNMERSS